MNILRRHRRAWGFRQQEIARILGYKGRGPIPCYETKARELNLRNALGYPIIFEIPITGLVPELMAEIHETIECEVRLMRKEYAEDMTRGERRKWELLERIAQRYA
jgi:hypothetical protein